MTSKLFQAGLQVNPYTNPIMNGGMEIWERGTSFAIAVPSNTWTADRWLAAAAGSGAFSALQSTDVPSSLLVRGSYLSYSLQVDVTTAITPLVAGIFHYISHQIEGHLFRIIAGGPFTLTFWVKSPKTGIHSVSFRNGAADRAYVAEYVVNTVNTWEYKTITVPSIPAGTWDYDTGVGVGLFFALGVGEATLITPTPNAWANGNYIASPNNVNLMDNTANNFYLTGLRIVPGNYGAPYVTRGTPLELLLCQRYSEILKAVAGGIGGERFGVGSALSAVAADFWVPWKVQKRAVPAVNMTGTSTWNIVQPGVGTAGTTSLTASKISLFGANLAVGCGGGLTTGFGAFFAAANNTATISVNAEL
jgi:hypothetical protein